MRKYPSIENHYRQKFIDSFKRSYPEIENECFLVQEKIDGTNFSIEINKNDMKPRYYSRRQETDKNFYSANENGLIDKITIDLLFVAKTIFEDENWTDFEQPYNIQFYGELFGNGIQNRINYGEKKFKIFDISINDQMLPLGGDVINNRDIYHWLDILGYIVSPFAICENLHDALNIDVETLKSRYADDYVEGIVIKPYNKIYINHNNKLFYLKKKRNKFVEKTKNKKKNIKKEKTEADKWNEVFQQYFNESRLQSIFSKEGEIQEPNEIGKYIKLITNDMKEDFLKDEEIDIEKFDKKEQKKIFNMGSIIAQELEKYL